MDEKFEVYEGQELRKDQKEVLIEMEKTRNMVVPFIPEVGIDTILPSFGFYSKAGYIIELGMNMMMFLPESVGKLTHLKKLRIDSIYIPQGVPEGITVLQELEELRIGNFMGAPGPFDSNGSEQRTPLPGHGGPGHSQADVRKDPHKSPKEVCREPVLSLGQTVFLSER